MRPKWILSICVYVVLHRAFADAAGAHMSPVANSNENEATNSHNSATHGHSNSLLNTRRNSQSHAPSENEQPSGNSQKAFGNLSVNDTSQEQQITPSPYLPSTTDPNTNQDGNREGKTSRMNSSNRPTPPPKPAFCTYSTPYYDCQIENVILRENQTRDFGLSDRPNPQTSITFRNSRLAYLPKSFIDAFSRMQMLNIADLQIYEIQSHAFDSARDLKTLYMQNNFIERITNDAFAGAIDLTLLELSHNRISSIDDSAFNRNRQLQRIYLNENQITKLPALVYNNHLQSLNISHNKLTTLEADFSDHRNLETIDMGHNLLTEITIPNYARWLNAANNNISNIVSDMCDLRYLKLSHNEIKDISFLKACENLELLDLSFNLLEGFSVNKKTSKLTVLRLSSNKLFEIGRLPSNLRVLDVSNNKLSFIPNFATENLEVLLLEDNLLIKFDFSKLKNLKHLSLSKNEWNCDSTRSVAHLAPPERTCSENMHKINGICCREYEKPYLDVLKPIIRDTFISEQNNLDSLKSCSQTRSSQSQDTTKPLQQKIKEAEKSKQPILRNITDTENTRMKIENQIRDIDSKTSQINEESTALENRIEGARYEYGVIKEGLIDSHIVFERVVNFIKGRNDNNKQQLSRRNEEKSATEHRENDIKTQIEELRRKIEVNRNDLSNMKKTEKGLKTVKQKLEKTFHGNSPSIGGRGK